MSEKKPFYFKRRLPCSLLAPYVGFYYIFHVRSDLQMPYPEIMVPKNYTAMVLHFGEIPDMWSKKNKIKLHPALLHGILTVRHEFMMKSGLNCLGIHFKRDGLFRLFDVPMRDLTNNVIDLRLVDNTNALHLIDDLQQGRDDYERFSIIETYLLNLLDQAIPDIPLMELLIQTMIRSNGQITVRELCKEVKVSRQYMGYLFRKRIGLNPKTFIRLIRFNHVLELLKDQPEANWQDIVQECGFYDQSHIDKDFRKFLELSPTEYQKRQHIVSDLYSGYK